MNEYTPLEWYARTGALPAEETPPSLLCWLWLADLLGPGNLNAGRVLDACDNSACRAWEDREAPYFTACIGPAAARRLCQAPRTPADFAPVLARCAEKGITVIPFDSPDYPLALARIPDPPLVLYCTGHVQALNLRGTVGLVGTRRPSQYGLAAAASLGDQLAAGGAVIVSGLADGLDSEGHWAAVRAHRPTVAVLGTAIDKTYPAANRGLRARIEREGGAVISEYAPGETRDYKRSFLQRNRIIAALSIVLLVVEAGHKSGTMSTVAHAERYGRPIYAVPGSLFSALSEGTNDLLRQGRARAAVDAADILAHIGLPVPAAGRPPAAPALPRAETAQAPSPRKLPENAARVLACIGARPVGLEQLSSQTGLAAGALLGALTCLELGGYIAAQPGRQYVLK